MASGFPDPPIETNQFAGRWWVEAMIPGEFEPVRSPIVSRESKEAAECIAQKIREACQDHRDDDYKNARGVSDG